MKCLHKSFSFRSLGSPSLILFAPLPQLLPRLNEMPSRTSSRECPVVQIALPIRFAIEIPPCATYSAGTERSRNFSSGSELT
jgi:hypothetical protein